MKDLKLDDIRNQLIRQEETLIFSLIERAQFKFNEPIYLDAEIPIPGFEGCFCDYLLYETEKVHAKVRRYTSPDEEPFFTDLPDIVLPAVAYNVPLIPNAINVNADIMALYKDQILKQICQPGDCGNYGSSATCDVICLHALSKRIHYGKFVAEAKFQADEETYTALINARDAKGIEECLINKAVEAKVLARVESKATTYGQEPGEENPEFKVNPQAIAQIYEDYIIPLTIKVEVDYLLQRLDS